VDAIRTAVHELEQAGYITRSRERKENGQLGGAEYVIREQPQMGFTPDGGTTPHISDPPTQREPISENPTQATSTLAKSTQLNKECKAIKEKENIYLSNTDSIPFHSPRVREGEPERNGTEAKNNSAIEIYREIILENI
jgi:hypothetical protein